MIHKKTSLFTSTSALSSSLLSQASLWSSWKDLLMSISSKSDIPSLPWWTPTLATKSLLKGRLFRVHVATTVWWLSPLLLITTCHDSQEGWRCWGGGCIRLFSANDIVPTGNFSPPCQPFTIPLMCRPPHQMKQVFSKRNWVTGAAPLLAGLVWRAHCLFWFVSSTNRAFWVERRPSWLVSLCPVSYDKCYHAPCSCYFTTRCLTISPRFPTARAAWPKSSIWTAVKGLYLCKESCVCWGH